MRIKRLLKYPLILVLIVSVVFLYSFTGARNGRKKIIATEIEFTPGENHFLNHEMVNKLLIQNNTSVQNQAKTIIDLYQLEKNIVAHPYIKNAAVYITIHGVLHAEVTQRKPIARIVSENESYYVDSEGVKIPLSEHYSARVLIITGVKSNQHVEQSVALTQRILNDSFLKNEIVGVHFNAQNEVELTVRSGDYKIIVGDFDRLEDKFKNLKAFYSKTFSTQKIQEYKTINLKYHNQVVCSK